MHTGVSSGGPGQPHVSQAGAMMGMQQPGANGPMGAMQGGQPHPGGGGMAMQGQPGPAMGGVGGQGMAGGAPGMHALNHLTPQQQQQMLQQQQMRQSESFFLSLRFGWRLPFEMVPTGTREVSTLASYQPLLIHASL